MKGDLYTCGYKDENGYKYPHEVHRKEIPAVTERCWGEQFLIEVNEIRQMAMRTVDCEINTINRHIMNGKVHPFVAEKETQSLIDQLRRILDHADKIGFIATEHYGLQEEAMLQRLGLDKN